MENYCDNCKNSVVTVPSFKKKYFGFEVFNKQVIRNITSVQLANQKYMTSLGVKGLINVTTVTASKAGNLYDYDISKKGVNYLFCNNKCACDFASKNNMVFLHHDWENDFKKRVVIPENIEANNALTNANPYRSLYLHEITANFLLPTSVLTTERLAMRDVEASDIDGLWEIYGDVETMAKFDPAINTARVSRTELANTIRHFIETNSYYWVIVPKQEPDLILGFCYIVNKGFGVHIEFAVNKAVRRKGVMTEALVDILYFLKANGINELAAFSELTNEESKLVLNKVGFSTTVGPVGSDSGGASLKYIHQIRL